MVLSDMTFLSRKDNVLPRAAGRRQDKACCHGLKVYFTTMHALIAKLKVEPGDSPRSGLPPGQPAQAGNVPLLTLRVVPL